MASRQQQDAFDEYQIGTSGLNIHQRGEEPGQHLVVFVHGLCGSGYGTWTSLPNALFSEPDIALDVGVFDYPTMFRRGSRRGVAWTVKQLVVELRECAAVYDSIYLVGHSLGGIVASWAIKDYLSTTKIDPSGVSAIAGLITVGSPLRGTAWALRPLGFIFDEFKILRLRGRATNDLVKYFTTMVEKSCNQLVSEERILLPSFALAGRNDTWVKEFSSTFAVPKDQRKYLNLGHTGLVRPEELDSEQTRFMLQAIRLVEQSRQKQREHHHATMAEARRSTFYPAPVLVTEFWAPSDAMRWEDAYHEARELVGQRDLPILDIRQVEARPVDFLIASNHAGSGDSAEQQRTAEALRRVDSDSKLTCGLAVVGNEYSSKVDQLRQSVGAKPQVYVAGCDDTRALTLLLANWLRSMTRRGPRVRMSTQLTNLTSDSWLLDSENW